MLRSIGWIVAGAACVCSVSLHAEDPKPAAPSQDQMDAMMKAWEASAAPGEEHKKLAEMAGKWDCKVEDYSSGVATTSEGKATMTSIMGGRFLVQEFSGKMGPMEFTGMGWTGYNNETKKFQSTWIDSGGTSIFFAEGDRKDDHTVEYSGKMTMPGMGEVTSRSVATHIDRDHHTYEMYMPGPDGKEMLAVKISYTRSK